MDPEEASPRSGPEQGVHAVRDPMDGLTPLLLPDQHPAPREVAAQHNQEGGAQCGKMAKSVKNHPPLEVFCYAFL